jgi:hypothetical protein
MTIAAVPQKTPSVFLGWNFSVVPNSALYHVQMTIRLWFYFFLPVSPCFLLSRAYLLSIFIRTFVSGHSALCSTLLCNTFPSGILYLTPTGHCVSPTTATFHFISSPQHRVWWSSLFSWPIDYTAVALWAVQHSRQTSALCGAIVLSWYMKQGCLTYLHKP